MSETTENTRDRVALTLAGTLAGVSMYVLFDVLPDVIGATRGVLFAAMLGLAFFAVLLALLGPATARKAVPAALAVAVPAALLGLSASFRFAEVEPFLESGYAIAALSLGVALIIPFVAAALEATGGWKDYPRLHDTAWSIFVRYAAAWVFVGLVWLVLLLCNTFLELVNVEIIEDIIDIDGVPWILSGLSLGLGISIVHEQRDYLSPFLLIQLLRILMPLLLLVLAVFIVALPFEGLNGLFRGLSPAVTMASVGFAGVTLVCAAVHREPGAETQGPILRLSAQALSVLVAIPGVLAVYAVSQRVGQYGLTPDRIVALLCAAVVCLYGLAYAGSVILRRDWTGRIRKTNLAMAGLVIALCVLVLTPILNLERMSVASQMKRAEAGLPADELPIWEFAREWGHAGLNGLARLEALEDHPEHKKIVTRVEAAREASSKWKFTEATREDVPLPEAMVDLVPVFPADKTLTDQAWLPMSTYLLRQFDEGCAREFDDGSPGCVMVFAPFDATAEYEQAMGVLRTRAGRVEIHWFELRDDVLAYRGQDYAAAEDLDEDVIRALQKGEFEMVPVERKALRLGDRLFNPMK